MVFANLQEREKDAFFSLLDEYFQSRPEIFSALSSQDNNAAIAATNIAQRAFSAAPTAASSFAKRNLGPGVGGGRQAGTSDEQQQDPDVQPMAGRVAAAAAAFSQHQRGASGALSNTPNKLGSIDTSSLKNVFANRASQNAPAPTFNKAAVRGPPQPESEAEEEAQGEWAEALYDYVSNEPGDLSISENQQILVTAKSSDDWWTGEVDGKSGLFPASYVKLL